MSAYELALLGDVPPDYAKVVIETLVSLIEGFGLTLHDDLKIFDANTIEQRDIRAAFAAIYFGSEKRLDEGIAQSLMRLSLPVIPLTHPGDDFSRVIPPALQGANGMKLDPADPKCVAIVTALLECVGLLRQQRRVFISYRRVESQAAAVQLHDQLSARGFDAFLDTHDIRPGDRFQDALWHRLCDSDVVVLLDTPGYFQSKWTRQEIGRARAKDIKILHVVWPGHTPDRHTTLSELIYLEAGDLAGATGPLVDDVATQIVLTLEALRSRSIAAKHMSIAGRLRAEVEKIGGEIIGFGAHRAMRLRLEDGQEVWAYPAVGVPTAETLHDVASKAVNAGFGRTPILVYDHIGIRAQWEAHLKWLDENIASVRAVRVLEAAYTLAGWEG